MPSTSRITANGDYAFDSASPRIAAGGFYVFSSEPEEEIIDLLHEILEALSTINSGNGNPLSIIRNRANGTIAVVLKQKTVVLDTSSANVNMELINENSGVSTKIAVTLFKGKTDGVYLLKLRNLVRYISIGSTYSYTLSSASTEINTVIGRFMILEENKQDEILDRIIEQKRRIDNINMENGGKNATV
jgi:hypothetical protein